jgi:hypothetical protein
MRSFCPVNSKTCKFGCLLRGGHRPWEQLAQAVAFERLLLLVVYSSYLDSHGQTFIGFGITRLLGFDLLARIKSSGAAGAGSSAAREHASWLSQG